MAKEKTEFLFFGGFVRSIGTGIGLCTSRHSTYQLRIQIRDSTVSQIKILRDNACYMYVGNAFCIIQDFSINPSWIFNPL